MELRRFFAPRESFDGTEVVLGPEEARHLKNVLRMRTGDEAAVFDGQGREFRCVVVTTGPNEATLSLEEEIAPAAPESPLKLTLATTLLKGDKSELVVQKAAELGVAAIRPLLSARCEVAPAIAKKIGSRWPRIALEAVKQCGRARVMEIAPLTGFKDFVREDVTEGKVIMFTERNGKPFSSIKRSEKMTAIFGPEGGWDDDELELGRDQGFLLVTLGGRIMRAETAAISIAAVLQHRFGDLS